MGTTTRGFGSSTFCGIMKPDPYPIEDEAESPLRIDSDFQAALVDYLEASERGERIDPSQVRRLYPQFGESIIALLADQEELRRVLSPWQSDSATDEPPVTIACGDQLPSGTSSVWSLPKWGAAEFPVAFGNYLLLEEIDRGGMGIVFKAVHQQLNRVVALKVMRSGEFSSDDERARFRAEAEASAAINHPHIISIFEVGECHGLTFFTMAYVDGETLAARAKRTKLTFKESARIVALIANAVEAAHQFGIIHRDLKPSNILVNRSGEPYLIDFGLAKVTRTDQGLTCTGQVLGTPAYMAPEQARGEALTRSCDIYSLGAVLYELVAGQPPFSGPTAIDILLQVMNLDPPPPRKINPQVPRSLNTLISRAMAREAQGRYESAGLLEADLHRFMLDEPIDHPKPSLLERTVRWWRREPALVSHLIAIIAVLVIVSVAIALRDSTLAESKLVLTLLPLWAAGCWLFQRVSVVDRYQTAAFWSWAVMDVVVYTTLIYLAETPRALLLIGYPMMIVASGLFYRIRFVVFVMSMCIVGFMILIATVDDALTDRPEFCVIYVSGMLVLALCVTSMIRKVRGLADYFARSR